MSKILTTKQAIGALLNGEKITRDHWVNTSYIYLDSNGALLNEKGSLYGLSIKNDYLIYKEPKKMIKVAPYLVKYVRGSFPEQTKCLYKSDSQFLHTLAVTPFFYQRLTALEVEVSSE